MAGGAARRMGGGDKGLRLLAGRPLLAHVIERMAAQVPGLALNANGDPARFSAFGLPVIADALPDRPGPLAGVLAGMEWAGASRADRVLTVPSDSPFLPLDLLARLDAALGGDEHAVALAASGGQTHYVVASWPVSLATELRASLAEGERKVRRFQNRYECVTAIWRPTTHDPFFNVNTPEDLQFAEEILALR